MSFRVLKKVLLWSVLFVPLVLLVSGILYVYSAFKCGETIWGSLGYGVREFLDVRTDLEETIPGLGPQWTSDGKYLVFVLLEGWSPYTESEYGSAWQRTPKETGNIYVASANGSSLVQITEIDGMTRIHHSPALSPDGSQVLYTSYRYVSGRGDYPEDVNRHFEIHVSNLDGSERVRVTKGSGLDFAPAWSPSGDAIAFMRYRTSQCKFRFFDNDLAGVYTAKADGSDLTRIFRFRTMNGGYIDEDKDSAYASGPVWSPDSRLLAYVAWEIDWYRDEKDALRSQAVIALNTITVDGANRKRLFSVPYEDVFKGPDEYYWHRAVGLSVMSRPTWALGGEQIGSLVFEMRTLRVKIIGRSDGGVREVAQLDVAQGTMLGNLSWSPDGLRMAFSLIEKTPEGDLSGAIYVVDTDGSDLKKIADGSFVAWSPDGSRIASFSPYGESPTILSTMSPDGTDAKVLVMRHQDGHLIAGNEIRN